MDTSPENLELQFLRTFKDYIYYFNMLERNIVYCLSHATKGDDYSSKVDKISSFSFDKKRRRLKNLIKRNEIENVFAKWFESVEYCQSMRNKIVHGHWEFNSFLKAPIQFDISAPTKKKGAYTMGEFIKEFEKLKKVTEDFSQIRSKYEIKEPTPDKRV